MRSFRSRLAAPSRIARLACLGALMTPLAATVAIAADESERLRTLFESYIGAPAAGEPSPVSVTRVGDDYELAIDLDRIAAPLKAVGLDAKLGRNITRLTPKPDGTWAWRGDMFEPWSWSAAGQNGRVALEGYRAEGLFDPSIAAFRSQTVTIAKVVTDQVAPAEGDTPRIAIHKTDEAVELTTSAAPAASGTGVDATFVQTSKASAETFTLTEGAAKGMPDMEATLKVGSTRIDGTVTGFRTEPFLAMWRHLVAHHAPEDFKAGQAALKARIGELGPLFEHLHQTASIEKVELETPVGFGSLGRAAVTVDTAGATDEGEADVTIALAGLEIHSLFIPGWANRLIPTDLTLHGKASGWDAESALAAFLEKADFAAEKPLSDEAAAALLEELLPDGEVEFDLAGNRVHAGSWDVTLEGHITASAEGASGTITVRGVGLDAAAAALRDPKAGEEAAKAAAQIDMAISLAEARDGALYWRFDFDGKAVSVNGRSLTGAPSKGEPKIEEPGSNEKKKGKAPAGGSNKI